jgi:hypothetical protein
MPSTATVGPDGFRGVPRTVLQPATPTVRPLLPLGLLRGGLRFLAEPAPGFFAGIRVAYHETPGPAPPCLVRFTRQARRVSSRSWRSATESA